MKNLFKVSIVFVGMLFSCGGGNSSSNDVKAILIKPKTTKVSGALGKFFTVVDGEHKYKLAEYYDGMLTISIKRNDEDFDFEPKHINPFGSNGSEKYHGGIGITIFDETSPILVNSATSGGTSGVYSHEDIVSLFNLEKGETGYVRWSYRQDEFKDAKTFKITSAFEKSDGFKNNNSYSDNSSNSKSNSVSEISNNWDSVLDDYENYYKEYKKMYKQAMNGDASALSNYMDILNEANDLASSLESASGELTYKQSKRMLKIQSDLLKVQ